MKFDNRTAELIAVGAAVAANCQSCVEYHVGKAEEFGVDRQEVAAAVEVGRMVRRGAAHKIDKLADGLLRETPLPTATPESTGDGCGCTASRL